MHDRLWLKLFIGVVATAYVVIVGVGWELTVVHGDYGLLDVTPAGDGQMITEIAPYGPASRAGLRPGDVIIDLDGTAASDGNAYWQAMLKTTRRAGEHATLVMRRAVSTDDAAVQQLDVTMGPGLGIPGNVYRAISYSIVGLLFLVSVSLVVLARPAEAAARVLLVAGICAAFALGTAIMGSLVENIWIGHVHYALAAMTIAAALHLSVVFPTTHPVLRLSRFGQRLEHQRSKLIALNYAPPLLLAFALPLPVAERWFYLFLLALVLAACALMFASYRYAPSSLARAQFRWVFLALTVSVGAWFLGSVVPVATNWAMAPLADWAAIGTFALFPCAIGIAILRYRLFDIDIIINRTLVYGSVTAVLAGVFAALSIVTQRVVLAVTGQESQAAVVLAALVVTALFQPLRARIQVVVDRRFYRRKYDATQTLERFALHLREEVELDRLADGLVRVVQETMQPAHVSLWLRPTAISASGLSEQH